MAGNINFGQNIYKTILRIFYDFTDIILCVESTVIAWFIRGWRRKGSKVTDLFYIPCTYICQSGQTFNFYTPAFIVSKMQMQQIVFVFYHLVNKIFYFRFCKKMTAYIKH